MLFPVDRGYVALNREALDPKKHKKGDYKEYVPQSYFQIARLLNN